MARFLLFPTELESGWETNCRNIAQERTQETCGSRVSDWMEKPLRRYPEWSLKASLRKESLLRTLVGLYEKAESHFRFRDDVPLCVCRTGSEVPHRS